MKDVLKVLLPNGAVLGVVTLTEIETILKITLLVVSLAYTLYRWRHDWLKHHQK